MVEGQRAAATQRGSATLGQTLGEGGEGGGEAHHWAVDEINTVTGRCCRRRRRSRIPEHELANEEAFGSS